MTAARPWGHIQGRLTLLLPGPPPISSGGRRSARGWQWQLVGASEGLCCRLRLTREAPHGGRILLNR